MNTDELKRLAEAAIHSDTVAIPFARAEFHAAAHPAAILELMAINSELIERLEWLIDLMPDPELDTDYIQAREVRRSIAAIKKAKGTES